MDLPSFRDHIAMLEAIRDRALAKGNEVAALSAQTRIGRALGYDRPQKDRADRADRNVRAPVRGRDQEEGLELDTSGTERDPAGTDLAGIGSNWHELADLGLPESQVLPEKLRPISDLLEKPIFAAEKEHADPSRRPSWLNGVSATALAGGQNCPPGPG